LILDDSVQSKPSPETSAPFIREVPKATMPEPLSLGDRVRIRGGQFAGMTGDVVGYEEEHELLVLDEVEQPSESGPTSYRVALVISGKRVSVVFLPDEIEKV
jgi:transcription antitermination factor NusG